MNFIVDKLATDARFATDAKRESMAIPYICASCGECVGVASGQATFEFGWLGNFDSTVIVDCQGAGFHAKPTRTERSKLWGLIKTITQAYPETKTTSSWEEYAGPPNKFFLWCAIVFGSTWYPNGSFGGVCVNGKWAWWELGIGFFGDGVQELSQLRPLAR